MHHALRECRGAARVDHAGHGVRRDLGCIDGLRRLEVGVRDQADGCLVRAHGHDVADSRRARTQVGDERRELLVHEQHFDSGIGDRVDQLDQRPADVQRHGHATCPHRAEVRLEVADRVERQDADTGAGTRGEYRNGAGHPTHGGAELPEPDLAAVERDERGHAWIDVTRAAHDLVDQHAGAPVVVRVVMAAARRR